MLKYVFILTMLMTSVYTQTCYTPCAGCNIVGNSSNHQCTSCKDTYYPLEGSTNMCFQTTDASRPSNYFFNFNVYTKCYKSCATCSQVGYDVAHNCDSCGGTNYPLSDNRKMCYQQGDATVPTYYIFQTNQFTRCYNSCSSCTQISTDASNQACTANACRAGYYPLSDVTTNCYADGESSRPLNYVLSGNVWQKCYKSCAACTAVGTQAAHNCSSCASQHYKLSGDGSMCFMQGESGVPANYVFITNIFQKCYTNCATCSAAGNPTTMNCLTCATNFYKLDDDATRCYSTDANSGVPAFYVYVAAQSKYVRCYANCASCSAPGDATNMRCNSCTSGYYPLEDNSTQCYQNAYGSGVPSNYVYVAAQNKFMKCSTNCATCSAQATASDMFCSTCATNYYPLSDKTSQCYTSADVTVPANYVFISPVWQKCYQSCATCTAAGTLAAMNCSTCASTYYALSDVGSQCYQNQTGSGVPANYVFVSGSPSKFQKCYTSCATCSTAPGTLAAMGCSTCASTYYWLDDNHAQCYTQNDANKPTNYIFSVDKFLKCYDSCGSCSVVGTSTSHQCSTCASTYYPLSTNTAMCYKNVAGQYPNKYVYVAANTNFQQCYTSCLTCTQVGTISAMACSSCDTANGYYPLSDNSAMCYKSGDAVPANYLFVGGTTNQWVKCHSHCATCSTAPGTDAAMACLTCAANYYQLPDVSTQCYSQNDPLKPANYNWNGSNAFYKCNVSCATCSAAYVDASNQNCLTCNTSSLYYDNNGDVTNCYQAGDAVISGLIWDCAHSWVTGSCYSSCQTCTCKGTQTAMKCTACANGLYPLSDVTSQCWADNDGARPANYALIGTTLQKCYSSCATCNTSAVGTATAMNCATCANTYYKLSDVTTMCYNSSDAARPANYVLDQPNNQWAKCYSSCATCTLGSDSTNHNCVTCITNNYKLPDKNNCYTSTGAPANYAFVNNAFVKCYVGCATCSNSQNGAAHNCLTCDTANLYYPLEDDSTHCYKQNPLDAALPTNYTFNASLSKFVHCYAACATCSAPGNATTMNCSTCTSTYYPLDGDTTKCYQTTSASIPNGYTFNCVDKFVQQSCYTSCQTCTCIGTAAAMNCVASSCKAGLYPLQDTPTQCWANTDASRPQNYILIGSTFIKCYQSCGSCTATGTQTAHNCTGGVCAASYYPLSDQTTQCYLQNDANKPANYVFNVNRFDKCYAGCSTCTIGSNSVTHNCSACAGTYFPLSDKTTQCYLQADPSRPSNYIFQVNTHRKCYDSCGSCSDVANSTTHNCLTCANQFYPLYNDTKRCFAKDDANLPSGFYFNATNNKFEACYSSCATCSAAGTSATNQNCLKCATDYYPLSTDATRCYKLNDSNLPSGYIYNCLDKFTQGSCYSSCATCSCTGTYTKQNCQTCLSTGTPYYPLVDNKSQCYQNADVNKPQNYVLSNNQFVLCYSNCASCSAPGTADVMNCKTCAASFYPLDDKTSLCYTLTDANRPANYYYNATTNKFSLCYSSCMTCSAAGTASTHNCTKCAVDYYRLSDNTSQCYQKTATDVPPNYIFVDSIGWNKCYIGCATCKDVGNSTTQYCKTCAPLYYPLENDNSRCFKYENGNIDALLPVGYRFNNNSWQQCYTSCGTCSAAGNATTHNCQTCKATYFPLQSDSTMCYKQSEGNLPANLVFDCVNNVFITGTCYSACKTCSCNGSAQNHYCTKCADNLYPLSDQTNMCYSTTDAIRPVNYIFQFNIFNKCDTSCATCFNVASSSNRNCITCANNYYPLEGQASNCFLQNEATRPLNYYFNVNMFSKCYQSCGSCTTGGDKNNHNCQTCATNYFPLDTDRSKCYFVNGDPLLPSTYGLDYSSWTFKPLIGSCYNKCLTCTSTGTASNHLCVSCIPGNYPVEGQPGMCYNSNDTTAIAQYYYYANMYRQCYVGCNGCTFGYYLPLNEHNCKACANGYYPLATNATKCFQSLDGYYLASARLNQCPTGCAKCTSAAVCTLCQEGYLSGNNQCYLVCPTGTYPDYANKLCKPCDSSCSSCVNGTSCLTCKDRYYSAGSDQLCGACFYNCGVCNSANKCNQCLNGWYLQDNACTNTCPLGTYPDTTYNICKPCTFPCQNCTSATTCTNCRVGYGMDTTTGICVKTKCKNTEYWDDATNKCIACVSPCATCVNASICNTCTGTLLYSQGKCLQTCPANTYYSKTDQACMPCSKMCASCTNNTDFCTVCATGTFGSIQPTGVEGVTRQCVQKCPTNYFPETTTNLCKTCSELKWVMYNDTCVATCPTGTTADSTGKCVTSSTGGTVTSCTSNPCLNSGTCSVITGGFACVCTDAFFGTTCQIAYKQTDAIAMINTLDLTKQVTSDQMAQLKILSKSATTLDATVKLRLLDIYDSQLKLGVTNKSSTDDALLTSATSILDVNVKASASSTKTTALYNSIVSYSTYMLTKNDYSTTNTAVTFGSSTSLSVTIVSTSDDGLKSANDKAGTNGWTTFQIGACVQTLKTQNSISGNLELVVYNMAAGFDSTTKASEVRNSMSVAFNIVNPTTGVALDLTKCSSNPTTFGIPVPAEARLRQLQSESDTATTFALKPVKYNRMNAAGVDIYNPQHPAYSNRCTSVVDPDTSADTTINYRITNYFQGLAIQCSSGCTYDSIDTKNNVKCICNGMPTNLHIMVVPATIDLVGDLNLDLFNCSEKAFGTTISNNPAFWLSTALLILFVLMTPCLGYVSFFTECQVTNGYGEKLANSSHIQGENNEVKRRRDASEYEHSFCNLFWLRLKEDHIFLSVFAHKSLAYPVWMRFVMLIFNLNLMFALSAFLFTDNLIYNRAMISDIDTRDAFFFPISNEIDRVALILVFTYIFVELFRFILKRMPADLLVQMESAATGGDINKAHDDVKSYNSRMRVKNYIVIAIMLCLHMLGWYYMIVFNAVYVTLAKGWAFGALNALILDYFGVSVIVILIKTVILSCLRKS